MIMLPCHIFWGYFEDINYFNLFSRRHKSDAKLHYFRRKLPHNELKLLIYSKKNAQITQNFRTLCHVHKEIVTFASEIRSTLLYILKLTSS